MNPYQVPINQVGSWGDGHRICLKGRILWRWWLIRCGECEKRGMTRVMSDTKPITLSPGFAYFRFFKVLSPLLSEMTNCHSRANKFREQGDYKTSSYVWDSFEDNIMSEHIFFSQYIFVNTEVEVKQRMLSQWCHQPHPTLVVECVSGWVCTL